MISKEWAKVKFGDIVDSISITHKFNKDKIIAINTSDVLDGNVLNHEYVPTKSLKGQFKKSFIRSDILYSEIRPINKRFAFINFDAKDYVASTKLMVLRKKNDLVYPTFLYQFLKSEEIIEKLQVIAESRSGTFPQITFTELSGLDIFLPPLSEQKEIADTLTCLDNKIELNKEIDKKIEEIAQTIFKSWFINFDPFQDSDFIESELGMIPKGWRVVELGSTFRFIKGKTPKKLHDRKDNLTPYLTIDVFRGGRPQYSEVENNITADKYDLLMIMDGASSGTVYYGLNGIVGSTFSKLDFVDNHLREIIYQYLKMNEEEIKSHNTGSAIPHADKGYINQYKIALPDEGKLLYLSQILFNLRKIIIDNRIQNAILTKIRDALMPKLMSGEIRVPIGEE